MLMWDYRHFFWFGFDRSQGEFLSGNLLLSFLADFPTWCVFSRRVIMGYGRLSALLMT